MEEYLKKYVAKLQPPTKVLLTRDDIETINVIMKSYYSVYGIDRKHLRDGIFCIRQFLSCESDLRMDGFGDAMRWIKAEHDFQGDVRNLINVRDKWVDQDKNVHEFFDAALREREFKEYQISHVNDLNDLSCVLQTNRGARVCFSSTSVRIVTQEVGWYVKGRAIQPTEVDRYEKQILKDIRHRLVDKNVSTVTEHLDVTTTYFISPKRNGIKRWLYAMGDKAYLLGSDGVLVRRFDLQLSGYFLVLVEEVHDILFMIDILLYDDRNLVAMPLIDRISFLQHIEQDFKISGYDLVLQTFYELNLLNEVQIATISTTAQEGVIFTPAGFYSAPVIKYKRVDTIDVLLTWDKDHYSGKIMDVELESPTKFSGKTVICEYSVDFKSNSFLFRFERVRLDRLKPNSDEVVEAICAKVRKNSFGYHLLCVFVKVYLRSRFYAKPHVRKFKSGVKWIDRVSSIVSEYVKLGWCTEEDASRLRGMKLDIKKVKELSKSLSKLEEYLFSLLNESG